MADNKGSSKDDDQSIWSYSPSFALCVVALALYSIMFVWISFTTIFKYRSWFFLVVVIGVVIEVAGYAARTYSTKNQSDIAPFVMALSLVVLAPVFIAAGNYLLIGRLIRNALPPGRHTVMGVPARLVTAIFVGCDVISFLAQCSGSGIASGSEWKGPDARTGRLILIGGLAFQAVAFSVYLCVVRRFNTLANRYESETAPRGWRRVMYAVYVSSLMILIRCLYRTAEFAQGIDGYAFTHEWLFWVFETLPMLIACAAFCVVHPSKYLGKDGGKSMYRAKDKPDEETGSQRNGKNCVV